MKTLIKTIQKPKVRKYLYTVSAALIALLGGYKLIGADYIGYWYLLASSIFGLASSNTDLTDPLNPIDDNVNGVQDDSAQVINND